MNTVAVRQAAESDLVPLAVLFDQYRQFQGQASNLEAAQHFLQERLARGESIVFVASVGGDLVGLAQLYPTFSSVALARVFILNDLFVAESDRRRGVASSLLSAVEAYAWSAGSVRVTLNVARGNSEAQALYGSRGWVQDAQFYMFHRYAKSAEAPPPREA